ncbi:MAG: PAS domain-containing protein [Gemmatimonadaceae bacterium]|nr:PAS domain-containing protein [Gloeobacterales cyanobacterium ES-bin-141]
MSPDDFSRELEAAYERVALLYRDVNRIQPVPELLPEVVEEVNTALEELRVAYEELRDQNEELIVAREVAELERQRYCELFEFAPDGYLVTDVRGVIREANLAAAVLLGVPQDYLSNKPLVLFVAQTQRRSFLLKLNGAVQRNHVLEWGLHLQPRHSPPIETVVKVAVVHGLGEQPTALRWLIRDLTAYNRAEQNAREIEHQNLQLVEASRLKSRFIAMMSHELRTPMNAILGFSQLLMRNRESLSPRQSDMVERIFNNGKYLLTLINDVLDLSRIEAGRLELKCKPLNLSELVRVTADELRSLAEQKNLQLLVNTDLSDPLVINDRTRLRQILVNLIANATKFTESGSIRVEVGELSSDRLTLVVSDTGIGIDEQDLDSIFEEFHQLNRTDDAVQQGTGMGLAITNSLVTMMGGSISVESSPGQGSVFRIELPRRVSP